MVSSRVQLSLLIPVYNGGMYLDATFQELQEFFDSKEYIKEIIFINDGSTDNTKEKLETLQQSLSVSRVHILYEEINKGKGKALQKGIYVVSQEATHVAFTDVELPYGLAIIEEMLQTYEDEKGIDMCYGDRTHDTTQRQYSLYRKVFTKVFRFFLPKPVRNIKDTQSGIKMFRADMAKDVFLSMRTHGWVFDVELFLIALRRKYKIHPMRVQIKPQCVTGKGGVSFFKHGWKILKDLLTVHYHDRTGTYTKK